MKNTKKINLFKIIRDECDDEIGPSILDKFYFCWSSVIEKLQKIKIPIYRDLSLLGRKATAGISTRRGNEDITDYIDSFELSFKLKELFVHDIISVASGRFTP